MRTRLVAVLSLIALMGILLLWQSPAFAQQTTEAAAPEITVKIDGEYGYGLPPAVYSENTYGGDVDYMIRLLHWFMGALFVGWGIFFVYCLVRYRQRPGHTATHQLVKAKFSKVLEVGVAVFEGVLLVFLAIPVWGNVKLDLPPESDNPQHVRIVAEQFAWNFHYPGPDGVFGKTAPQHIDTAINPLGIDENDSHGADDIVSGELHIIKDRPVIAEISTKDVIHSFWIPVLRVKQDAIPGMRIPVWFEAAKSGNYEVACAQLCGNNHYSMKALMVIHESQSGFDEWAAGQGPEELSDEEYD